MSATNKPYNSPYIDIVTIDPAKLVASSPGPDYDPEGNPTTNPDEIGSNRREQSLWD